MAISAITSVASFSVVLAETFAAVGLATLIPNGALVLARLAHAEAAGDNDADPDGFGNTMGTGVLEKNPLTGLRDLLKKIGASTNAIDLLLPKTARIHAEFEFEGRDAAQAEASIGGFVQMVSISAGYSALYEQRSSNKVTLDVEFAAVNVALA